MSRTPDPFRTLGFAAVDWIEHYLVHGPGDVQGLRIELDDEFAAFVVKAYQVDAQGNRLVRRAFLSRAKGRSKSGLAAMLACFEALGPCRFDHFAEDGEVSPWGYEYEAGEPVGKPLVYAEVLNVATEEGQAGNTYDAIYYMLNPDTCSPELLQDFGKIDVGITRTVLPKQRGFIEPVTSSDSSKDGGKSTFIVADETHLWILPRLKRLHGIMTRNLLKRKIASGWMLETSTMYSEGEDSVAEGTHAYAQTVKRDRTLLFDHRQASDKWDLTKRGDRLKALREAYGPAAAWMNLEAICDSWDDPQVSEGEFRRYWLNQPVPIVAVTTVIPLVTWNQLADRSATPPRPVGTVAFSIDTTPNRTKTSISVAGVRPDGFPQVQVVQNLPGAAWAVPWLVEHVPAWPTWGVVIDMQSAAASLVKEIRDAGLTVIEMNTPDAKQAFGQFYDACTETGVLRHLDQKSLNDALKGAADRTVGDAKLWDRKTPDVDITPLVSATNALWGWTTRSGALQIF